MVCALQVNAWPPLLPLAFCVQSTIRFLAVSIYHAELLPPLDVPLPPLEPLVPPPPPLVPISGMNAWVPVLVVGVGVGVCADAMAAGMARLAARRVRALMFIS
jgi:hypothetical protein